MGVLTAPASSLELPRGELFKAFAAAGPGLEELTAAELGALGFEGLQVLPGGVAFETDTQGIWRANLGLHTASRVLLRLGEFPALAFHELERRARRLPWGDFIPGGSRVVLRVTCRKSRLYHHDAVAERVRDAILRSVGSLDQVSLESGSADVAESEEPDTEPSPGPPPQLVFVRFFHDLCTVSLDSSGELLHRRGYRQAIGKAPLRETLASALILASAWTGETPLIDPTCGSGTIAIEAARMARGISPGSSRPFIFERWPSFELDSWRQILKRARTSRLPAAPSPIGASDRDASMIEAARSNAERAGVAPDLRLEVADALRLSRPLGQPGTLLLNPPYGHRLKGPRERSRLLAGLSALLPRHFAGWTIGMLVPDAPVPELDPLGLRERLHTRNGGLAVRFLLGQIPT